MSTTNLLSRSFAAVVLAGSVSQSAYAVEDDDFRFDTTDDLYNVCSVKEDAAGYVSALLACRAFIEATVQYHDEVTDRENLKRLICYPKNATIADGRSAFVAWAGKNTGNKELMGETPVVGLVRSLAARYPCK